MSLEEQGIDLKSKLAFVQGDLAMARYTNSEAEKRLSDLEEIRVSLSNLLCESRAEVQELRRELELLKKDIN